jgi:hypothetical protein
MLSYTYVIFIFVGFIYKVVYGCDVELKNQKFSLIIGILYSPLDVYLN